jgi:hypothetical protein
MNDQDRQHLELLSVFHYVVGALVGVFSCFPVIHLAVGIALVTGALGHPSDHAVLRVVGVVLILLASVLILTGWSVAVLLILAGRYLARRAHYTFCLVMAGVACAFFPFGTVLGILTIIVLSKPAVRGAFAPAAAPAP